MIVRVARASGAGNDYLLGYVKTPTKMLNLTYADVGKTMDKMYQEWFDQNPEPDTDEEFISWLVEKWGWEQVDITEHVI